MLYIFLYQFHHKKSVTRDEEYRYCSHNITPGYCIFYLLLQSIFTHRARRKFIKKALKMSNNIYSNNIYSLTSAIYFLYEEINRKPINQVYWLIRYLKGIPEIIDKRDYGFPVYGVTRCFLSIYQENMSGTSLKNYFTQGKAGK